MRAWLIALVCAVPAIAHADDTRPLPKHRWAADAMFVLPVDRYAEDADGGIGALARYEYRIGSKLSLTARGGPLFHLTDRDGSSLFMFLALAGMRYNLDPDQESGTFFSMAIGMNYVRVAFEAMGVKASDSEPELTLDIGGGFQVSRFQIRASVFYTPHVGASFAGDAVSYLGLALTFGYDFSLR
ncbi:MAG: hypothetical protein H0V17_14440 [Deltaproteobacteria bacterium]|nr:hypothetical protein [Deltaproteobacteria bacterium]